MFLDIVGYLKLLADEQKELVQELNHIVRQTEQFRAANQRLENLLSSPGTIELLRHRARSERWVKPKKEASR